MYIKNLKKLVCKKYKYDQEKISEWFAKHTASRRLYLKKMWDKDNRCVYCGHSTDLMTSNNKNHKFVATYEHKIPLSKGGTDARSNAALSCSRCNNLKQSMTHDEFIAFLNDGESIEEAIQKSLRNKKLKAIQKQLSSDMSEKTKIRNDIKIYILAIMMFDIKIKIIVTDILNELDDRLKGKQQQLNCIKTKLNRKYSDFTEVSL